MDQENIETTNSENGENQIEETTEESSEGLDAGALKQKNAELSDKNRQLFERAKKAEAEAKELKGKIKPEPKAEANKQSQSNDSDYGRLATRTFLKSEGVDHPDDQKIVMDEATRLKLPIDEVVIMEHMKSRIQGNKDQREAQAGISVKGGKRTGGATQHDVDYWLARSDERPADQEMAEKVLNAKMAQEKKANTFSDMMYNE